MNLRSVLGTLGMAAIVAATSAAASAQSNPYNYNPNYNYSNPYQYRQQSLINVGKIARGVQGGINHLNRDSRDYGGHRVNAISNLQNAENELQQAAAYAQAHGYQMPPPPAPANPAYRRAPNPYANNPQLRSDLSVERVQRNVQHWIRRLSRDSRDFGGHRAAAIDWLQRANSELVAGIQFAQSHGY